MKLAVLLLACFTLSSCSTAYTEWQGGGVQVGAGGACEVKDGIEIWKVGAPPRAHRIIGLIEDDRPGGVLPMAMRSSQVTAEVKKRGGDGVIMMGERDKYLGSFGSAQTFGTLSPAPWGGSYSGSSFGTSNAIIRTKSAYQVFKYVDAKPRGATR